MAKPLGVATTPNSYTGSMRPKAPPPLSVRDGLNPSRIRIPAGPRVQAFDAVLRAVTAQRYRHPEDGAASVRKRFLRGEVRTSEGRKLSGEEDLAPGTDLWFYRIPAPEEPLLARPSIIYADEDITVVHKPPLLAMTPRGRHVVNSLVVQLRRMTGNEEIAPAHRLDRDTSGLVLCTNRAAIRGTYQRLFEEHEVIKIYHAVAPWSAEIAAEAAAEGGLTWAARLIKEVGVLQTREEKGPPNAKTLVLGVDPLAPAEEKIAQQTYRTDQSLGRYLLRPVTGKTHQLRVQMAAAGVAILGDWLYPEITAEPGADDPVRPLMLRHCQLEFRDPITNQTRKFTTQGLSTPVESPILG